MRSLLRDVEEQAQRWRIRNTEPRKAVSSASVITISREPGSGGKLVAQRFAEAMKWDVFHQDMVHKIADSAKVSGMVVQTLDEKGLNTLEDWVSSMIQEHHLWPDAYLKHLLKVVGTIARHGNAVIVGRGANFILRGTQVFRVRVIAPLELRIRNVAEQHGGDHKEVKRRVIKTDSDRKAFIRKYFHKDIADPLNYDMVINTGHINLDRAVQAIKGALGI